MPKQLPPNIEQLPSGHYRGRYFGPDGRRHSTPPYRRAEQAQWALEQARGDIAKGDWIDPEKAGITLDRWFALWLPTTRMRGYVREKEQARYNNHISPYLGKTALSKLTPFAVTTWHQNLASDGRTAATIGKAHDLLKACLGSRGGAMSDERIKTNPCQLVQPPPVTRRQWRLITVDEFDALLAEIPEQWRAVFLLAVFTGLRWSEIVGLQRRDYNPVRAEITVRRGIVCHKGRLIEGDPKDHEERTVPVVPKLAEALNSHIAAQPMLPAAPLFTMPEGDPLRHNTFMERIYKPAAIRCGLAQRVPDENKRLRYQGVRFHDLRHSCASWLLNGGMDIHEVKELLGHASITTTQRYAHTDKAEMRRAMLRALGE